MPLIGLAFTEAALAFLETIPHKHRAPVVKKAKALLADPHPQGSKKLRGITTDAREPVYRERSGDYRILYIVTGNPSTILILDIDHRKDVYR